MYVYIYMYGVGGQTDRLKVGGLGISGLGEEKGERAQPLILVFTIPCNRIKLTGLWGD